MVGRVTVVLMDRSDKSIVRRRLWVRRRLCRHLDVLLFEKYKVVVFMSERRKEKRWKVCSRAVRSMTKKEMQVLGTNLGICLEDGDEGGGVERKVARDEKMRMRMRSGERDDMNDKDDKKKRDGRSVCGRCSGGRGEDDARFMKENKYSASRTPNGGMRTRRAWGILNWLVVLIPLPPSLLSKSVARIKRERERGGHDPLSHFLHRRPRRIFDTMSSTRLFTHS